MLCLPDTSSCRQSNRPLLTLMTAAMQALLLARYLGCLTQKLLATCGGDISFPGDSVVGAVEAYCAPGSGPSGALVWPLTLWDWLTTLTLSPSEGQEDQDCPIAVFSIFGDFALADGRGPCGEMSRVFPTATVAEGDRLIGRTSP